MEDYTSSQKIVKINKRGKIIRTFEEMIENNKKYSDVIPLIIC